MSGHPKIDHATADQTRTEICIVGAGVAGITLARELARSGTSVILVESGTNSNRRRTRDLNNADNSGMPYWAVGTTRQRLVGGTASMWVLKLQDGSRGLRLRPLDPIDFESRDAIPNSGWPIAYNDLTPYHARTEELFRIVGGDPWNPVNSEETFGGTTREFRTVNFRMSPSSLFSDVYPRDLQSEPSVRLITGATITGLSVSENGSTITSANGLDGDGNPFAIQADKFVLACGGIETPRLLLLSSLSQQLGTGSAIENVGRYFMEHPHFVSGRIVPEDRRWLTGDSPYVKHASNGTGNNSAGENDTESVTQIAKFSLSEDVIRENGLPNFCIHLSRSRVSDHSFLQSKTYDATRILLSHIRTRSYPRNLPGLTADLLKGLPSLVKEVVSSSIARIADDGRDPTHLDLYYMSEQAPDRDSRVTLSDKKDALGLPRAHLHWKLSNSDFEGVLCGQDIIDQVLKKTSTGELIPDEYESIPPPGIRGGFHHMGTTRMSDSDGKGVVDRNCKMHGTSNLYIAGSSVFPTGGFANPTFTIGALAIRLADHLKGVG